MEAETAAPVADISDIAAAMAATEGRTPSAVIHAFLPVSPVHHGLRMLPLTAGHEILLAQFNHPLTTGEKWDATDVLLALYIFTHPSIEQFEHVADDTFRTRFFQFVNSLPASVSDGLAEKLITHWMKGRDTALAMESEHGSKKKAGASDGSSPSSPTRARFSGGCLGRFFTRFRWLRFWR